MKITTKTHGWAVYRAICDTCGFEACMFTDQTPSPAKVRNAAKAHAIKTGHEVTVEAAKSWNYVRANAPGERPGATTKKETNAD